MNDEMTETMTPRRPMRPEELFDAAMALRERAEKAEAEVERLKEQLDSTKQLALKFWKVLEENGFKMELQK